MIPHGVGGQKSDCLKTTRPLFFTKIMIFHGFWEEKVTFFSNSFGN